MRMYQWNYDLYAYGTDIEPASSIDLTLFEQYAPGRRGREYTRDGSDGKTSKP